MGRRERKSGAVRSASAVILFVVAIGLAGLSAFLAWQNSRERDLRRQAEADSAQAAQTIDGLEGRLAEVSGALDEANDSLAEADDTIGELQRRLQEDDPFVPGHPAYEDLYPDFYAPQPLDASQVPDHVIFLTFDDGPSNRTDEILPILEQEGVKATFFEVGAYLDGNQTNIDRAKRIVAAGHTLAMHSYSHNYKTCYASVEAFLDDFYKVFTIIRDQVGYTPTMYRFPGGSTNAYNYGVEQDIIAEMLRRGFVPYDWNMSAQDATAKPLPVETILANVMAYSGQQYGVVLMHDSNARTTTVQALPEVIRQLRNQGYTFAAITPEVKPVLFGYKTNR